MFKITEALEEKNELLLVIIAVIVTFILAMYYVGFTTTTIDYLYDIRNIGLFLLFAIIIYLASKNTLELKEKKEEVKLYPHYENLITEYGDKQHEYGKHLQTVNNLIYLKDEVEMEKHLKEYMGDLKKDGTFIDSKLAELERKPFAAYLHFKITQLKSAGIDCWLDIMDYTIASKIKDYKLVEAVGILIDNAWEATDELNKDVKVRIVKQKNGRTAIEVLNKYRRIHTKELEEMLKRGYSTKGDKRGFGLYNLEKIIRENSCELAFENREIDGENYVCFILIL